MEILLLGICKALLAGFFIGGAIGLTGIGGGVLVMPCLIYIMGVPPVPAVGTGLLFAFFAKLTGIVEHHRLKNIDTRLALFFTIGSAPAALLTSQLVNYLSISGKFPGMDIFLQYVMGSILVLTAFLFIAGNIISVRKENWNSLHEEKQKRLKTLKQKAGCVTAGSFVGMLIGSTSIGGGILIIPILSGFFKLGPAVTVGTSILISIIPVVLGGAVYAFNRNIDINVLIPMFLGSLPGTIIGSRLTAKIPQSIMRIILLSAIFAGMISFFIGARR